MGDVRAGSDCERCERGSVASVVAILRGDEGAVCVGDSISNSSDEHFCLSDRLSGRSDSLSVPGLKSKIGLRGMSTLWAAARRTAASSGILHY